MINIKKLGLASGIAFSILYVGCILFEKYGIEKFDKT